MPSDPTECRERARECQRIADTATNERTREAFENLATTWLRLANDLERSKALLDTWGADAPPPPYAIAAFRKKKSKSHPH
jgi:hypothetical protein